MYKFVFCLRWLFPLSSIAIFTSYIVVYVKHMRRSTARSEIATAATQSKRYEVSEEQVIVNTVLKPFLETAIFIETKLLCSYWYFLRYKIKKLDINWFLFQAAVRQTLRPFTIYAAAFLLLTIFHMTDRLYEVFVEPRFSLKVIRRLASPCYGKWLSIKFCYRYAWN